VNETTKPPGGLLELPIPFMKTIAYPEYFFFVRITNPILKSADYKSALAFMSFYTSRGAGYIIVKFPPVNLV